MVSLTASHNNNEGFLSSSKREESDSRRSRPKRKLSSAVTARQVRMQALRCAAVAPSVARCKRPSPLVASAVPGGCASTSGPAPLLHRHTHSQVVSVGRAVIEGRGGRHCQGTGDASICLQRRLCATLTLNRRDGMQGAAPAPSPHQQQQQRRSVVTAAAAASAGVPAERPAASQWKVGLYILLW